MENFSIRINNIVITTWRVTPIVVQHLLVTDQLSGYFRNNSAMVSWPDPSPRLQWDGSGYARLILPCYKHFPVLWALSWMKPFSKLIRRLTCTQTLCTCIFIQGVLIGSMCPMLVINYRYTHDLKSKNWPYSAHDFWSTICKMPPSNSSPPPSWALAIFQW